MHQGSVVIRCEAEIAHPRSLSNLESDKKISNSEELFEFVPTLAG